MDAQEGAIVRHNESGDVGLIYKRKDVVSPQQQGWWLSSIDGCASGGLSDRALAKDWTVIAHSIRDLAYQRDTAVRKARKLADGVGLDFVDDDVLSLEWADAVPFR